MQYKMDHCGWHNRVNLIKYMKAAKNKNNKIVLLLQDIVSQLILQQARFRSSSLIKQIKKWNYFDK